MNCTRKDPVIHMETHQLLALSSLMLVPLLLMCPLKKKRRTKKPQPQPQNTAKHESCGNTQQTPSQDMHVSYLNSRRMLHAFCIPMKASFPHNTED